MSFSYSSINVDRYDRDEGELNQNDSYDTGQNDKISWNGVDILNYQRSTMLMICTAWPRLPRLKIVYRPLYRLLNVKNPKASLSLFKYYEELAIEL